MLAIERKNALIKLLNEEGRIVVSEVKDRFNVTDETIRRDIDKLAKEGIAEKSYGGATSKVNPTTDLPYNIRKRVNVNEKQYIADLVASMIKDGDRLMLDASSTAIYIVRKIKNKKNITIITNSIEILFELSDKTGWTILSTGGALREGAFSLFGQSALKMIENHHVDYAICSCKGIDTKMGITDSNEKDSEMKKHLFMQATKRILVVDSSKFDNISFIKVGDVRDIDTIVTDKDPGESWKKIFEDSKVELIY